MRRTWLAVAMAAGLAGLTGCDLIEEIGNSGERFQEDFHYSYAVKPGGRLALENFNGTVEITGWDSENVDISGTKYAPTPELRDAIRIDITHTPDSIYIRTIRPSERRGNLGARYVIKVPRQIQLDRITSSNGAIRTNDIDGPARLRTSNGSVRAANLRGNLEAQTSNGAIDVQTVRGNVILRTSNGRVHAEDIAGTLDATTSNGSINAQLLKAEADHAIRLQTTNGSVDLSLGSDNKDDVRVSTSNGGITVRLPASINARLMANTSNSSVTSEFEVKAQGTATKHHLEGEIGSGGPLIDLSTTNGHIRLLKL